MDWIITLATGAVGFVVFIVTAYFRGKSKGATEAKVEQRQKQAEATAKAIQDRKELNDDIQDDTDLVARARNANLVRPESKF